MTQLLYWNDFFTEAGIPKEVAGNYAELFTDHRIQRSLLADLTKDILHDMGIHIVGDIIAIIKQAKHVILMDQRRHATASETAPTRTAPTAASPKLVKEKRSVIKLDSSMHHKSLASAARNAAGSASTSHATQAREASNGSSRMVRIVTAKAASGGSRAVKNSDSSEDVWVTGQEFRSVQRTNSQAVSSDAAYRSVSLRGGAPMVKRDNVPVPMSRRVLPEHEGRYKVNLPKGTTPKTRAILRQLAASGEASPSMDDLSRVAPRGGSVFNRLGGSSAANKPTANGHNFQVTRQVIEQHQKRATNMSSAARDAARAGQKRSATSKFDAQQDNEEFWCVMDESVDDDYYAGDVGGGGDLADSRTFYRAAAAKPAKRAHKHAAVEPARARPSKAVIREPVRAPAADDDDDRSMLYSDKGRSLAVKSSAGFAKSRLGVASTSPRRGVIKLNSSRTSRPGVIRLSGSSDDKSRRNIIRF